MKVKAFLKKSGISQYNLDVANKEEKDTLVTMFQLANKEIFDLKKRLPRSLFKNQFFR